MELLRETEMEVGWQVWQARPPQPSMTVVVKATYELALDGACTLAAAQALPVGDAHHDDDPERSLRSASDLDPLKPSAECMVIGSFRAPRERAMAQTVVSFQIGPIRKELAIFGDRAWRGRSPSAPARLTEVPLAWERAFGGRALADNPVGRGLGAAPGEDVVLLPNVEDPSRLISSRDARPAPAGCGPIPRTWTSRLRLAGTYDATWMATRYPWFPVDLDWRYFLAAPVDQRIEGYWRGDEEIALKGLHPEHDSVRCRLPGQVARAFVVARETDALTEVGLKLDTITVDADLGLAYCVWRGVVEVGTTDLSDIRHLYVVQEPLGERTSAERMADRYRAKLAADAAAEASENAVPFPSRAIAGASAPASGAGDTGASAASTTGSEEPGARWAHLDQALTFREGDEAALQAALRTAMAARRGGLRSVFDDALLIERPISAERLLSPEELIELEMMNALGDLLVTAEDPRREEVRRAVSNGESLRGRDLSGVDLSGLTLVEADLRGAILVRANLSGAFFERCRFDGANLREAELTVASFDGCSLVEADMTSVRAHRVRMHATSLDDANIISSYLREARFMVCRLSRAEVGDSDLTESNFRECVLPEADFSGSTLERAVFQRCELVDVWLERGVKARGVRLDGCDASLLRASEGADLEEASFKKTALDGARFGGARLRAASFNLAKLSRADFSDASLEQASLMGCDLRWARFDRASLVSTSLLKSNLMQASFEGANLHDADLRGANLFQAELFGARLDDARLDLANLAGTRAKRAL